MDAPPAWDTSHRIGKLEIACLKGFLPVGFLYHVRNPPSCTCVERNIHTNNLLESPEASYSSQIGSMLAAPFRDFKPILFLLLSFISAAAATAICDIFTYGQPSYVDCRDLLHDIYGRLPGSGEDDGKQRFYSLIRAAPPPWIPMSVQNLRQIIPILTYRGP